MKTNYSLIPEKALLASLPEHLQRRFEQALQSMQQNLEQQLTWQQIARHSAISPAHFHRQFKALFHETPGHYLSRIRLQFATEQLLRFPERPITEIAHQAGFSESQAFAKAVKRTLGLTAKAIKHMANNATPQQTAELVAKLSQPFAQGKLEQNLAENIPAELVWITQRTAKTVAVDNADWELLLEQFGAGCEGLIVLTPIQQLDRGWQHIDITVCDWHANKDNHDVLLKEGYFLSAEITLKSAASYFAAFDGLFNIARQRGLTIDTNGFLTEQLLDYCDEAGATFLFQMPIAC